MAYRDDEDREESATMQMGPATEEEVRRQLSQNINKINHLNITTKDGNAAILGVKIPKTVLPFIQLGLDQAKLFVLDKSDTVYKNSVWLAGKLGVTGKSGNRVGVAVENTVRWGVIGVEQIGAAVEASNEYARKRKELRTAFTPVMQATGANARNNDIIRLAYERARSDYWSDLKWLLTDLPRVVPMAMVGWKDQVAAKERRKKLPSVETDQVTNVDKYIQDVTKTVDEHVEAGTRIEEALANARARFIEKQFEAQAGKPHQQTKEEIGHHYDENIEPRIKWRIENDERAAAEAKHRNRDNESGKDDKAKADKTFNWVTTIGSVASQVLKVNLNDNREARRKRLHAEDMIELLGTELESQCNEAGAEGRSRSFTAKSPDEITINGASLKSYIMGIFQQHERDLQYNNKLIDPLQGAMVEKLLPAIDLIAAHLADGSLSANTLLVLVGGNKVIAHTKNGGRVFANEAQVKQVIEDQLVPVLSTRETKKLEEILAKFSNPKQIRDTIKNNLTILPEQNRALFSSLFSDDILEQLGQKKNISIAMRKQGHSEIYDFLAANVLFLNEKGTDHLKKIGVSDQDLQLISSLADKIQSGDVESLKQAIDGGDKSILDAVRTAALLEQVSGPEGQQYWVSRQKEIGNVRQTIKEAVINTRKDVEAVADGVTLDHPAVMEETRNRAGLKAQEIEDETQSRKFSEGMAPVELSAAERIKQRREQLSETPEARTL